MKKLEGVYTTKRKDGSIYHRASITHLNKHISLGSYDTNELAHSAYVFARELLTSSTEQVTDYMDSCILPFTKWVVLLNYRDNQLYFHTPIYLKESYFLYYLSPTTILTFDRDDLFYYAKRTIMQRKRHLFVADYGMQVNILNRYGIRSYSVCGRDYRFINDDVYDFRYSNIEIINPYMGVQRVIKNEQIKYKTTIHLRSNYVVGYYETQSEAAIAYNKAVDQLRQNGFIKEFITNYIEDISPREYAEIYSKISISKRLPTFSCNQSK
ncbi:MAG: hypothetical protein R3Y54_03570 [Eubacteriales bacterium]